LSITEQQVEQFDGPYADAIRRERSTHALDE
jgi:hypothetical protein